MPRLFPRHALSALCAAAALTACGGDGGDGGGGGGATGATGAATGEASRRGTDVPASALQSVSGLLAYMNDLIANSTNETGQPVLLGDGTLPMSDTTEAAN